MSFDSEEQHGEPPWDEVWIWPWKPRRRRHYGHEGAKTGLASRVLGLAWNSGMGRSIATVEIRLLGPVRVLRGGTDIELPRSRKVRALLAFLALEPAASSRSRLCDLLWDAPNDPRGELRWYLSKLRSFLDDDERKRVVTTGQSLIALDLSDCVVDAIEVARLVREGLSVATSEQLDDVARTFAGDFLDGMQVDGPELTGWLTAQRQRLRGAQVAILHELTARATTPEERLQRLDPLLRSAPYDRRAHETMIATLVESGRVKDAETHLEGAIRAFEQEGADWTPLRTAFQSARRPTKQPPGAGATVVASASASPPSLPFPTSDAAAPARHGSVVVMPFEDATADAREAAHGLTDDIISRLAKLRVLFVIARGTSYALKDRGVDAHEAGRILNVDYVVSGSVRRRAGRLAIRVELAEARSSGIVWTDEIETVDDETFSTLDSIVNRIVAGISDEIENAECKRAVMKPPSSLDAWEAYHRGLWHVYKFTATDNELGAKFFRDSLAIDPSFARAHAGLSFAHFQNVFLDLTSDRDRQLALALETATASLAADDRDPAAHWSMGRALWLRGERDESVAELHRSVELSPNFALGHYTLGFVECQSGDPRAALEASKRSRELSPFDPLQFGMLASAALAHARLGELEVAASLAQKAAARPNAHTHIVAIAAWTLALAKRRDDARSMLARARERTPRYGVDDFVRAFRCNAELEAIIRSAARTLE